MLFDEIKNIVTPSDGIAKLSFDPKNHTYGFNMGGNTKVGEIPTFSTLMGDYTYKKLTGKLKNIKGTCGNCGSCKKACYVRASYRFPSVIYSQAVNTWGMRNELDKVERDLAAQIKRRDIKVYRINQSGELENEEQLAMWCRLAEAFPETRSYLYTKMYGLVEKFLKAGLVPKNLTILYSVWKDQGVKEYERVKDLPNVKAFVYDDGDVRLETKIYCPAYVIPEGSTRAVRRPIHCDHCRLCIDKPTAKVIGCHDH